MFKELLEFLGKGWHTLSDGAKRRFSLRRSQKGQQLPASSAQKIGLQKKQAVRQMPQEELIGEENEEFGEGEPEEESESREEPEEELDEGAEEGEEDLDESDEEYLGEDKEVEEELPQPKQKRKPR